GLNFRVSCSATECFKAAVWETNLRRIYVCCYSRDLGQLISKRAVDAATVENVILKTKGEVIQHSGTERVIPIDSYYLGALQGCTSTTDNRWKSCKRRLRQPLVIKHLRNVILRANVFVNLLSDGIRVCP